ncbi:MAG: alpha/beta hydrolase, partial [Myxococcota bacterium]
WRARNREWLVRIAGLILESTFPSVAAMAGSLFGVSLSWVSPARFDAQSKIAGLRAPLLFFHGDRDEIVPYELGQQLFEAAPEPKTFETIRGAGHNNTIEMGGGPYFDRIRRFLDEVAPG